ncbi:uncharacterized protein LOC130698194 [Daphnia carinata]|uniref:uncharacterized protein LOC130698194 n=1 Tax=Daphnia carinata TaxID=120202 RepID=UPI00257D0AFE|nr:uncharacterized protein LOC130698194 [Daphnia carinata]
MASRTSNEVEAADMTWIVSLSTFKKWCAQLPVLFSGLLVFVASTLFYHAYFLQPTGNGVHQWSTTSSLAIDAQTSAEVETLLKEKLDLQQKVNALEMEKKKRTELMANIKESQRQLNATLNELNQTWQLIEELDKEIAILEANATVHRNFFDYFSNVSRQMAYPGVEFYTRYTMTRLGLQPLAGIEPLKPQLGPVINDVLSYQYPLTVPPCRDVTGVNRTVFVAIISATDNFEKRSTTRPLWPTLFKSQQDKGLMGIAGFAFILGKPDQIETQKRIEEESRTYGDIIQIEMVDAYRNLTLKLVGLFSWLHTRNCSKVDFVVKVDDDVFVNVRNLVQFVQSQSRHDANLTIFGTSAGNLWPARDGKWELTYAEWPWHSFPRYFNGPAVLFPGNTIVPLLASFQTTPMPHIDDIYFSGICVERAGIKISYSTNSTNVFEFAPPDSLDACDLRRFISRRTPSSNYKNNSHVVTEDFYNNRTSCVMAGPKNGTNTTIDYTAPAHFYFL